MASASQAIDRIVTATGEPEAVVSYLARYLREAGLWPKGKLGGGKGKNAAHVEVQHLANFLLAYLGADAFPLTHAAEVATTFRALEPKQVERLERKQEEGVTTTTSVLQDVDAISRLIEPAFSDRSPSKADLGSVLEGLVSIAMQSKSRPSLRAYLKGITLSPRDKTAIIETMDQNVYYAQPTPAEPGLPLDTAKDEAAALPIAPKSLKASVTYDFIEVLADLALDTQRVMGGQLPLDPLDQCGPETSTPPRATGAASDLVNLTHANAEADSSASNAVNVKPRPVRDP